MINHRCHPVYLKSHRVSERGFTLVELMVTIAVMGVIVSLAAPSFNRQLADQRVKDSASKIDNALKQAKTESFLRKNKISMTYNNTNNSLTLTDPHAVQIAQYTLNNRSEITLNPATQLKVTFDQGRRANTVTYTICDSGSTQESPRQVSVDANANVSSSTAGSC